MGHISRPTSISYAKPIAGRFTAGGSPDLDVATRAAVTGLLREKDRIGAGQGVARLSRTSPPVALLVIGMAISCTLLLAWPAWTVTTAYLNDIFIFLDG